MSSRKALSKKVRFEVFKRDSFTCQYCGRKAPEVVLNVDHIDPVASGGCSEIINLITACFDCNSGKKDRKLSDNSAVEKQTAQLAELQERRTQLQMMMDWREELRGLDSEKIQIIQDEMIRQCDAFIPNENGIKKIASWTKKFDLSDVLDSIETSFSLYIQKDPDGKVTSESWNKSFNYVPRILANKKLFENKPYMKDLYYIRGIIRNRCSYVNDWKCLEYLVGAYERGADLDMMKEEAKSIKSWTHFVEWMSEYGTE